MDMDALPLTVLFNTDESEAQCHAERGSTRGGKLSRVVFRNDRSVPINCDLGMVSLHVEL